MKDLQMHRDNIANKLGTLEAELPSLKTRKEDLQQKRLHLLTEAALKGNGAHGQEIAELEKEHSALDRIIADNEGISSNLKIRLKETERVIRVQKKALEEMEYLGSLDSLDAMPVEIEVAFEEIELAISKLHSLTQKYATTRLKRKTLTESFKAFMEAEGIGAISQRVTLSSLADDDAYCDGLDKRVIEVDNRILELAQTRRLDDCAIRLVFFR